MSDEPEPIDPATARYLAILLDRWCLVARCDEAKAATLQDHGFVKMKREREAGGIYRWHAKRTHQGRAAVGLPPLN